MEDLINAISEMKDKHKLNDRQFSLSLNINPSYWSYMKRGLRKPGEKFLSALIRVYPELNTEVIRYMSNSNR